MALVPDGTPDSAGMAIPQPNECREGPLSGAWARRSKRMLDVTIAAAALIALTPLLLFIALAVRLDSAGPILFRQSRCGRGAKPFTFLKFRGMVADAEARLPALLALNEATGPLFKMRNDPRLTRVGRVIRRTSLDELPQLWNVLRGEMSLVGPRPPLPSEVENYSAWQRRRLLVLPGITGAWQVSGRSDIGFDDMVRLDVDYIENWSLFKDITILLRTVLVVLTTKGAY
jgi:exopolysaccharide biosynthesis polyprenyl glycosylphosphotransferase